MEWLFGLLCRGNFVVLSPCTLFAPGPSPVPQGCIVVHKRRETWRIWGWIEAQRDGGVGAEGGDSGSSGEHTESKQASVRQADCPSAPSLAVPIKQTLWHQHSERTHAHTHTHTPSHSHTHSHKTHTVRACTSVPFPSDNSAVAEQ